MDSESLFRQLVIGGDYFAPFCSRKVSRIWAAAMASRRFFFFFLERLAGAILSSAAKVVSRSSWKWTGICRWFVAVIYCQVSHLTRPAYCVLRIAHRAYCLSEEFFSGVGFYYFEQFLYFLSLVDVADECGVRRVCDDEAVEADGGN